MFYNNINANNNVSLHIVEQEDASFILSLRNDINLNEHISQTSASVYRQEQYILDYKIREYAGSEYYYIVQYNAVNIGTVRMYNINNKDATFTWGSWILLPHTSIKVAITSAYLIYFTAFEKLNLHTAFFDVRNDNRSVKNFHSQYASRIKSTENNTYFKFSKDEVDKYSGRYRKFLPTKIHFS